MYITFKKSLEVHKKEIDLTIQDFLLGRGVLTPDQFKTEYYTKSLTFITEDTPAIRKYFNKTPDLHDIKRIPVTPEWNASEISNHYESFKIPKKSGGLRDIDAPDDELKLYLTNMKLFIENILCVIPSEAAHAYVQGRSTITCMKVHQSNESKWFLKLDLKDFFPSHTLEYTMEALKLQYPFYYLFQDAEYKATFEKALSYGFLNNRLPQGTPLSPTLTNILMTPIDKEIQKAIGNDFIYTRYADDLLISSKYSFNYKEIEEKVKNVLKTFNTPFQLKTEKTRYGSSSGSNWNLGVMLNKDNRLTIGHKQNQRFRAALNTVMQDFKNGITWDNEDKLVLQGQIAYYKAVDPKYTQAVITRYESKFGLKLKTVLKTL